MDIVAILLGCSFVDILEFWSWANACHSSAFPSFQTNKGGHEMDIRMVFCVNSREPWRLAQCFALEGLITSSWRYGPMGAIVPWQEELLRCCTDMTLLHFFNELDPFLICFPKRFLSYWWCVRHPHYESERDAERIPCACLSVTTFMLLKVCMWGGVFFFSIFKRIWTLDWALGCWVESENAEMVVVNDWLLLWVWGWDWG